jgi:hypothetical protein
MLEEAKSFLEAHIGYLVLGVLGIIGLVLIWRWLNRPGKEELEHQRRFQDLKEKSRDRYKDFRPLK